METILRSLKRGVSYEIDLIFSFSFFESKFCSYSRFKCCESYTEFAVNAACHLLNWCSYEMLFSEIKF